MTRRKFLYHIGAVLSAIAGCVAWMGRKALPQRTVRADCSTEYPGTIVPLGNIRIQSKWSG